MTWRWCDIAGMRPPGSPHPLAAALSALIDDAQAQDPMRPVTVIAPSRTSALALRRQIALARGGMFAVRFEVLPRLAELLAAAELAAQGMRPLRPAAHAEAIRAVLREQPGWLAPVAGHPATVGALQRTLADLAAVEASALAALPGDRGQELRRLAAAVRTRLADRYDQHTLERAAADRVRRDPQAAAELGSVIALLTQPPAPAAAALLQALAGHGAVMLAVRTGDPAVDSGLERLAAAFGAQSRPQSQAGASAPPVERILSAPDPDSEVRAAVRLLAQRFHEGVPLHRMALLWTSTRPYALLVRDALAAAELPASGLPRSSLSRSVAGVTVRGALALAGGVMEREAVMAWLAAAPVRAQADGPECDSARWDLVSRHAGIVRDPAQWTQRLRRFAEELRWRAAQLTQEDEVARARGMLRDAEHADALSEFMRELSQALRPPRGGWRAHAEWALALLDRYLGEARQHWPEAEIDADRGVRRAVRALADLDEVSDRVDLAAFRRALDDELQAAYGADQPLSEALFTGEVSRAVGMDFDVVAVVGMGEGLAPAPVRQDPLLRDQDRRRVPGLRLAAERTESQRRGFAWVLHSGAERILCTARSDPRGGRERLPSRWLLQAAAQREGAPLTAEELAALPPRPWRHWLTSFPQSLGETPAGAGELELAVWTAQAGQDGLGGAALPPVLVRGMEALRDRRQGSLTRWTGLVGGGLHETLDGRALSPTRLEAWAACPFRYYLTRVLDIDESPRPEQALRMDPRDRGKLVHRILERFFTEYDGPAPEQAWPETERARLHAIADQECARFHALGITGKALLWQLDQQRLRRELDAFLRDEPRLRAQWAAQPHASEQAFGFDNPDASVTVRGHTVAFRGYIDRIDRAEDGTITVIDYKTGKPEPYTSAMKADPVGGGQLLQLPVYALAARGLAAAQGMPVKQVHAAYWFVTEDGIQEVAWREAAQPRFAQAVNVIADGIAAGVFPQRPDRAALGGSTCDWCAFTLVCDSDRHDRWQQVRTLPLLEGLRDLQDGPPVADTTSPGGAADGEAAP